VQGEAGGALVAEPAARGIDQTFVSVGPRMARLLGVKAQKHDDLVRVPKPRCGGRGDLGSVGASPCLKGSAP